MSSSSKDRANQLAFWQGSAGRSWTQLLETLDETFAPVSGSPMARSSIAIGASVIDVGCSCGASSIELACVVGRDGEIVGIDVSPDMLERARMRTPPDLPVTYLLANATVHAFPKDRADLLFSRFGAMFFSQPKAAFSNLKSGLKPGGRVLFSCWRDPRENPWLILPLPTNMSRGYRS